MNVTIRIVAPLLAIVGLAMLAAPAHATFMSETCGNAGCPGDLKFYDSSDSKDVTSFVGSVGMEHGGLADTVDTFVDTNTAAGYASIWEELRALNVSVSDGNCGALDAVACADALLEGERADLLLVGGAEAMSEALFVAFDRLHAFGDRERRVPDAKARSLPWQRSPAGVFPGEARLGEGAVLFALETEKGAHDRAKAQGMAAPATLATVCGYGASFEPPKRAEALLYAAPVALERAIQSALDDAGVPAGDVDAVVSGISGIRAFDAAELTAIDRTVGASGFVSAPKLAHGETLGAGGALAILTAIAHMRGDGSAYAVRGTLRGPVRTVVVTALGYYGNAAALVMKRPAS